MMITAKNYEKKTPLPIAIGITLFLFLGILTGIFGIENTKNYLHPYIFYFFIGGIGLATGIYMAIKIKPYVAVNKRLKSNYSFPIISICTGFIGIFLLIASLTNKKISILKSYNHYTVVNKYRQEYHYRSPEINTLVVNIDGKAQKLICSYNYWLTTEIGQNISLGLYESKIGFDFIEVIGDKK